MKLTLTPSAVKVLEVTLAGTGWGKSDHAPTAIKRIYLAGKVLCALPKAPTTELELDEASFEVCKHCLTWYLKEGRVPAGAEMDELIKTFQLYQE